MMRIGSVLVHVILLIYIYKYVASNTHTVIMFKQ
jgi:hypothetical protein